MGKEEENTTWGNAWGCSWGSSTKSNSSWAWNTSWGSGWSSTSTPGGWGASTTDASSNDNSGWGSQQWGSTSNENTSMTPGSLWGSGPPRKEEGTWRPLHQKHGSKPDSNKQAWPARTYYEWPGKQGVLVHFDPTVKDPPGSGPERFDDVLKAFGIKKE